MKYTNKKGLPFPIVKAVEGSDNHRQADYSATGLLKEECQHALLKQYPAEEKDVSDSLNILWGKAVHAMMETEAEEAHVLKEQYMEVKIAGKTVSGTADRINQEDGSILDYKTVSVYSMKDTASHLPDWESQLNVYAFLAVENGHLQEVKKLSILAIARDWRRSEAMRDDGYPPEAMEIPVKYWGHDVIRQWMQIRVLTLENATSKEACSPEFRWADPRCWAVVKKGRKTAVKLHESQESAMEHATELGAGHSVEHRSNNAWKRCAGYCDVSHVCPHYQAFQNSKGDEE